jgi:hypothetical protein
MQALSGQKILGLVTAYLALLDRNRERRIGKEKKKSQKNALSLRGGGRRSEVRRSAQVPAAWFFFNLIFQFFHFLWRG